ncbi:MAG: tRNA (adenosine(37)-N6)-threonylcarbamoyltransferase complex ATPase subunit type 1 TsaE [Kiritimatiellaeota bacterium]|nr:tRNA (adenosine(37)-N6)-threonylcarbamoyltransferase complex ATPase subunit type 1 TsaE [Kiritimatiellota bacterium]
MDIHSTSERDTLAVGEALARRLAPGTVVGLYGDLGTGKTVMARGMARALGITEPVVSPTFMIVQEYRTPAGLWFYHLDLYRIDGVEAALGFGIEEFLFAPDSITAVEWPERIAALLEAPPTREGQAGRERPTPALVLPRVVPVYFEHVEADRRRIRIPAEFAVGFKRTDRKASGRVFEGKPG